MARRTRQQRSDLRPVCQSSHLQHEVPHFAEYVRHGGDRVVMVKFLVQRRHWEWRGAAGRKKLFSEAWRTVTSAEVDVLQSATLAQCRRAIREQHPSAIPAEFNFAYSRSSADENYTSGARAVTRQQEGGDASHRGGRRRKQQQQQQQQQEHHQQQRQHQHQRLTNNSGFMRARDFCGGGGAQLLLRIPGYIEGEALDEEVRKLPRLLSPRPDSRAADLSMTPPHSTTNEPI